MLTKKVIILNRDGIHARPASLIVQTAQQFDASIWIKRENTQCDAKSIMDILALGANYQAELFIEAEGQDENEAVEAMVSLFNNKFQEG